MGKGMLVKFFEAWREEAKNAHVLVMAQVVRMWRSRATALAVLHAWRGELTQMWFFLTWKAWISATKRRLQLALFIARIRSLPCDPLLFPFLI